MATHSPFLSLIQFLSLIVVILAIPQLPDTSCYTMPPYHNTTTSCSSNSSSTQMIPSTSSSVVYSSHQSTHYSHNSQTTHYECEQYPSQSRNLSISYHHEYPSATHTSYNSKLASASPSPHTTCQVATEFPTSSPTSIYPSSQTSASTSSSPMCTPGIDVNKPGVFELWSYAPGICDLDNKVVTSSV